jgi:hypothetical protein
MSDAVGAEWRIQTALTPVQLSHMLASWTMHESNHAFTLLLHSTNTIDQIANQGKQLFADAR